MDEVTAFGEEVLDASWDEHQQLWRIRTTTLELSAEVIIDGSGALSEPAYPSIDGLDRFHGPILHSARWDHGQDVSRASRRGDRHGRVRDPDRPGDPARGGGDDGLPAHPGWVLPRWDREISGTERRLLRAFPVLQRALRAGQALGRDRLLHQLMHRRWMRRAAQAFARAYLRRSVEDPELRAKLTPDFEIGCKRILITSQWYPALTKPNVSRGDLPDPRGPGAGDRHGRRRRARGRRDRARDRLSGDRSADRCAPARP